MDAYDIFKKITKGVKFVSENKNKMKRDVSQESKQDLFEGTKSEEHTYITNVEKEPSCIKLLSSLGTSDGNNKQKNERASDSASILRKNSVLKQEKVNQYRNENNIKVVGRHVPEPAKTFDELAVNTDIIKRVKMSGYAEPTPIQKQAIPAILQNRNLLACAPTGSGKTAAFLIPIIHSLDCPKKMGIRALIICPTRELAKQIQRECNQLLGNRKLNVCVISNTKKINSQNNSNTFQKFDILIATPNRVCYLLKQDPPALSLENVQWLVIDEADKLFETGIRGFREQLEEILTHCTNTNKKVAMFSATHTPAVAKWCVHNLRGLVRITVGERNAAAELVDQELLFVGNEQGKLLAFRDLVRKGLTPPVLVFVQSKERAQQLFNELVYDGINVDAIHADRTQLQRDNTVRSFREGQIWVLICTELMARGIDFKGVNLVINYDFPPSAISYVHRIGRAGRAGRKGKAITFFTTEDTINLRSIASILKNSKCEVPDYMLAMRKRNKKERKKLESSAPSRDDITTRPIYEIIRRNNRKRKHISTDSDTQDFHKKKRNHKQIKEPANKRKRKS